MGGRRTSERALYWPGASRIAGRFSMDAVDRRRCVMAVMAVRRGASL
ncbi:MAG: hypothetical protein HW416_3053 [Chloroflexi bacterium]|nr:hypothetical protein [Chloroflexota bacterium]